MASACPSEPQDLFAFKRPILLGSSKEGFYGAPAFPPAAGECLLTKPQGHLSLNGQSFSIKARARKSPSAAQTHPSQVETNRTCPPKTLSFCTHHTQTKPQKQISDVTPQSTRGTIVMKEVQVFTGELPAWFGFPPKRTCFMLCRISKALLSSSSPWPLTYMEQTATVSVSQAKLKCNA